MCRIIKGIIIFFSVSMPLFAGWAWENENQVTNNAVEDYITYNNAWCIGTWDGTKLFSAWKQIVEAGHSEVFFSRKTSMENWITPVQISANTSPEHNDGDPSVAVRKDTVHVVWYGDALKYRRSTNAGTDWGSVATLDNDGLACEPSIADYESSVHIAYAKYHGTAWDIFYQKSTDGGGSWTTTQIYESDSTSQFPSISVVVDTGMHPV